MTTEIRQYRTTDVQGETLSLSTTVAALGVPPGRDGEACRGVVLRCPSDFRYHVNPPIRGCLRTQDAGTTFTDATDNVRDRDTSTVLTLNSQDTAANGDYVYVGADKQFTGIVVDVGNTNGNDSVMTVEYYNGSAWADASATDGTIQPAGKTLGKDGNITWALPSDWAKTTVNTKSLYWVRITFSAALDSSVTVREMALLNKDTSRGYAYANQLVALPLSSEDGAIEAILTAGTATLDVTWFFGNLPLVTVGGLALIDSGGNPIIKIDDAAFTAATSSVMPMGALADETTPDSVDEGDVGIPRMTLARVLRVVASDDNGLTLVKADDAAFTAATSIVVPIGALADETATDSVDEGDVGAPRMTLNRILRVIPSLHNGTTEGADSMRDNVSTVVLASAARTAETNSADQTNHNGKALIIIVDVSAIVDTPALTPTLEIKDSISNNYFTVWRAAAALTATGTYAYLFDIGGAGLAGLYTEAVNLRIGRTWRLQMEVGDADSATYSVSAEVLL